jgi:hypothetical protein
MIDAPALFPGLGVPSMEQLVPNIHADFPNRTAKEKPGLLAETGFIKSLQLNEISRGCATGS